MIFQRAEKKKKAEENSKLFEKVINMERKILKEGATVGEKAGGNEGAFITSRMRVIPAAGVTRG